MNISPQWHVDWRKFIQEIFVPCFLKAAKLEGDAIRVVKRMGILPKPFPILKAGPTTQGRIEGPLSSASLNLGSSSLIALAVSAQRWVNNLTLFPALKEYLSIIEGANLVRRIEWAAGSILSHFPKLEITSTEGSLGRLGTKDEPAGKIRVFAMVDAWTQWILRPLHDAIFELISRLDQDGTFDQTRPVDLMIQRLQRKKKV